jgi:hypothetical protein
MAGHDLAANNCKNNGIKLDHVINYCFSFSKTKVVRARKVAGSHRPKLKSTEEPLIPIVFITIKPHKPDPIMLRALLDSGAGASLIAEKYCNKQKTTQKK